MPHARLTHPTRPTLEFRQGQTDRDDQRAVANITNAPGLDDPPLVHIETRERGRTLTGRVTAPRRAANDTGTSDWEQALANYVDLLEAHLDEFQGFGTDGYTFEDDIRSDSFSVVYTDLEWTLSPGAPYQFEWDLSVEIGRGVMESQAIDRRNPTVDTSMSVAAIVDGNDLPGLREFTSSRDIGTETKAIYNKSSAEDNEVIPQEGAQQEWTFRGTHTGTDSQRASADAALDALIGGGKVTFETRWPGYHIDGFVVDYNSNLESRFGEGNHQYELRFIEGERA